MSPAPCLNSSQQVGGSLGTALLNTVFAATVTAYLAANAHTPQEIAQLTPTALIHGYHVAFVWGAALFTAALLCAVFLDQREEGGRAEPRPACRPASRSPPLTRLCRAGLASSHTTTAAAAGMGLAGSGLVVLGVG